MNNTISYWGLLILIIGLIFIFIIPMLISQEYLIALSYIVGYFIAILGIMQILWENLD